MTVVYGLAIAHSKRNAICAVYARGGIVFTCVQCSLMHSVNKNVDSKILQICQGGIARIRIEVIYSVFLWSVPTEILSRNSMKHCNVILSLLRSYTVPTVILYWDSMKQCTVILSLLRSHTVPIEILSREVYDIIYLLYIKSIQILFIFAELVWSL